MDTDTKNNRDDFPLNEESKSSITFKKLIYDMLVTHDNEELKREYLELKPKRSNPQNKKLKNVSSRYAQNLNHKNISAQPRNRFINKTFDRRRKNEVEINDRKKRFLDTLKESPKKKPKIQNNTLRINPIQPISASNTHKTSILTPKPLHPNPPNQPPSKKPLQPNPPKKPFHSKNPTQLTQDPKNISTEVLQTEPKGANKLEGVLIGRPEGVEGQHEREEEMDVRNEVVEERVKGVREEGRKEREGVESCREKAMGVGDEDCGGERIHGERQVLEECKVKTLMESSQEPNALPEQPTPTKEDASKPVCLASPSVQEGLPPDQDYALPEDSSAGPTPCKGVEEEEDIEVILDRFIDPVQTSEESHEVDGIRLATVKSKILKVLLGILSVLDKGDDLEEFFQMKGPTNEKLACQKFSALMINEMYDLYCNLQYLHFPDRVSVCLLRKVFQTREYLKYQVVREKFNVKIELIPYKVHVVSYLTSNVSENPINPGHIYDLGKYLYEKYISDRVKIIEKLRETSHFLFCDQLYFLPLKYHPIHEDEEEIKNTQIDLAREDCAKILDFFKIICTQLVDSGFPKIFEKHFTSEWLDDQNPEDFIKLESKKIDQEWEDKILENKLERIYENDEKATEDLDKQVKKFLAQEKNQNFKLDLEVPQDSKQLIEDSDEEKVDEAQKDQKVESNKEDKEQEEAKPCIDVNKQEKDSSKDVTDTSQEETKGVIQQDAEKNDLTEKASVDDDNTIKIVEIELDPPLSILETMNLTFLYEPLKYIFNCDPFCGIKELNLRGCISMSKTCLMYIIKSCKSVKDLNISFIPSVDDDVVIEISKNFKDTLEVMQVRYCHKVTIEGIIAFCENISGYTRVLEEHQKEGKDTKRLAYHFPTESKLERLNLADNKQLRNEICKPIANFLFPILGELNIWGNHYINDKGFLDLCITRSENFQRINYCGCYKVSDDSRLWLTNQFPRMVIYNKVDEFGAPFYR
ncbi:unnamed protein product [Moneuplotes crassus]|uniref:Uncharacterized protein n=1 Tax=Euplotes crassus TaxID=5936 RepID=A0AAD2D6K9_EUPCR|nr:unnamed protein product [Moneuplotes crassus]